MAVSQPLLQAGPPDPISFIHLRLDTQQYGMGYAVRVCEQ